MVKRFFENKKHTCITWKVCSCWCRSQKLLFEAKISQTLKQKKYIYIPGVGSSEGQKKKQMQCFPKFHSRSTQQPSDPCPCLPKAKSKSILEVLPAAPDLKLDQQPSISSSTAVAAASEDCSISIIAKKAGQEESARDSAVSLSSKISSATSVKRNRVDMMKIHDLKPKKATRTFVSRNSISIENSLSSEVSSCSGASSGTAEKDDLKVQLIKELEKDLARKSDELEVVKDRLSDRELEVAILEKRLSLRSQQNGAQKMTNGCDECKRKEKVIGQLYEKMEGLEAAVDAFCNKHNSPKPLSPLSSDFDLDQIMKNISELNHLVTENERDVEYVSGGGGAKFNRASVVALAFYADGFQVDKGRFRLYSETASKTFLKDLNDGFFPAEMQGDYPNGVTFLVQDSRFSKHGATVPGTRVAFSGRGRMLESRPASSASSVHSTPRHDPILPPLGQSKPKTGGKVPQPQPPAKTAKKPVSKPVATTKTKQKPNPLKQPASYSPFSAKAATVVNDNKCQLKIHGIDDAPFLLELVSYDTVKTLRGVLANVLKAQQLEKQRRKSTYKSQQTEVVDVTKEPSFTLYFGLPKQKLTDDSLTLGDLGLAPNGVLHVSKR